MGMTSAAEAKLDARVRPQIVALRARTSYPKRRSDAQTQVSVPAAADSAGSEPTGAALASVVSLAVARAKAEAAARARAEAAGAGRTSQAVRPAPIRLTRRGKIVVGTLIVIGVATAAGLIWLAIAGQAQASGHAKAGRLPAGAVARVVVRSGQTLWGIATQVDPDADPRVIIPQIVELNSLASTAIEVGEVLWVPRT